MTEIVADLPPFAIWILLGLVAGTIAKFLMPGKDPGGFLVTILIGVAGSYVGGYLAGMFHIAGAEMGKLSAASIGTAVGGALVLLVAFRILFGRSA